MARIPLNIIVTDPTKKENVEATLSKSEWMQGHKYMVHALETSKFKNSKLNHTNVDRSYNTSCTGCTSPFSNCMHS
jgi:hypothetical protein